MNDEQMNRIALAGYEEHWEVREGRRGEFPSFVGPETVEHWHRVARAILEQAKREGAE